MNENNAPPGGDFGGGVLIDNATTLTLEDVNGNGQPHINEGGFRYEEFSRGAVDAVVVAGDGSTANILGGTYAIDYSGANHFRSNIAGLLADRDSQINVNGGVFIADSPSGSVARNYIVWSVRSELNLNGGTFISNFPHIDSTNLVNTSGGGTTNFNGSRFEGINNSLLSDSGTMNITDGVFTASRLNTVQPDFSSEATVTGGDFVALINTLSAEFNSNLAISGGSFKASESNSISAGSRSRSATIAITEGLFTADLYNIISSFGRLDVSGGAFTAGIDNRMLVSEQFSTYNISGGQFMAVGDNSFAVQRNGTLNISGGTFSAGGDNILGTAGSGTLNLSGGDFNGPTQLNAVQNSTLNLLGGHYPMGTTLRLGYPDAVGNDPLIAVSGGGFALNGVPLDFLGHDTLTLFDWNGASDTIGLLDGADVLTGTLWGGSPFSLNVDVSAIDANDLGGRIALFVPEPATMVLFGLGFWVSLAARRRGVSR